MKPNKFTKINAIFLCLIMISLPICIAEGESESETETQKSTTDTDKNKEQQNQAADAEKTAQAKEREDVLKRCKAEGGTVVKDDYDSQVCLVCGNGVADLAKVGNKIEAIKILTDYIKACWDKSKQGSEDTLCYFIPRAEYSLSSSEIEEIKKVLQGSGIDVSVQDDEMKIKDTPYVMCVDKTLFWGKKVRISLKGGDCSKFDDQATRSNEKSCKIIGFELPQEIKKEGGVSGFVKDWIGAEGDPKYLLYYESFPEGEEVYWRADMFSWSAFWILSSAVANFILGPAGGVGDEIRDKYLSGAIKKYSKGEMGEAFAQNLKTTAEGLYSSFSLIRKIRSLYRIFFGRTSKESAKIRLIKMFLDRADDETLKKMSPEQIDELVELLSSRVGKLGGFGQEGLEPELKNFLSKQLDDVIGDSPLKEEIRREAADIASSADFDTVVKKELGDSFQTASQTQKEEAFNLANWKQAKESLAGKIAKTTADSLSNIPTGMVTRKQMKLLKDIDTLNNIAKSYEKNTVGELDDFLLKNALPKAEALSNLPPEVQKNAMDLMNSILTSNALQKTSLIDKMGNLIKGASLKSAERVGFLVQKAANVLGSPLKIPRDHKALVILLSGYLAVWQDSVNEKFDSEGRDTLFLNVPNLLGLSELSMPLNEATKPYYINLLKDGGQPPTRFHLVSPCKADLTVKTTEIECKLPKEINTYSLVDFGNGNFVPAKTESLSFGNVDSPGFFGFLDKRLENVYSMVDSQNRVYCFGTEWAQDFWAGETTPKNDGSSPQEDIALNGEILFDNSLSKIGGKKFVSGKDIDLSLSSFGADSLGGHISTTDSNGYFNIDKLNKEKYVLKLSGASIEKQFDNIKGWSKDAHLAKDIQTGSNRAYMGVLEFDSESDNFRYFNAIIFVLEDDAFVELMKKNNMPFSPTAPYDESSFLLEIKQGQKTSTEKANTVTLPHAWNSFGLDFNSIEPIPIYVAPAALKERLLEGGEFGLKGQIPASYANSPNEMVLDLKYLADLLGTKDLNALFLINEPTIIYDPISDIGGVCLPSPDVLSNGQRQTMTWTEAKPIIIGRLKTQIKEKMDRAETIINDCVDKKDYGKCGEVLDIYHSITYSDAKNYKVGIFYDPEIRELAESAEKRIIAIYASAKDSSELDKIKKSSSFEKDLFKTRNPLLGFGSRFYKEFLHYSDADPYKTIFIDRSWPPESKNLFCKDVYPLWFCKMYSEYQKEDCVYAAEIVFGIPAIASKYKDAKDYIDKCEAGQEGTEYPAFLSEKSVPHYLFFRPRMSEHFNDDVGKDISLLYDAPIPEGYEGLLHQKRFIENIANARNAYLSEDASILVGEEDLFEEEELFSLSNFRKWKDINKKLNKKYGEKIDSSNAVKLCVQPDIEVKGTFWDNEVAKIETISVEPDMSNYQGEEYNYCFSQPLTAGEKVAKWVIIVGSVFTDRAVAVAAETMTGGCFGATMAVPWLAPCARVALAAKGALEAMALEMIEDDRAWPNHNT